MITDEQKNAITASLSRLVPEDYRFAVLMIPVAQFHPKDMVTLCLDNCGTGPLQRRQVAQVLRNTAKAFDPHGS